MYPLLACDLEGCINDVEYAYILRLNPFFNIFIVKKLLQSRSGYEEPSYIYKIKQ
jgi:hypothetical protein